jgi:hypothetical protein
MHSRYNDLDPSRKYSLGAGGRVLSLITSTTKHIVFMGLGGLLVLIFLVSGILAFRLPGSRFIKQQLTKSTSYSATPTRLQAASALPSKVLGISTSTGTLTVTVPTLFKSLVTAAILKVEGDSVLDGNLTVDGSSTFASIVANGKVTFKDDVTGEDVNLDIGSGKLTASNVVYSVTAGSGISVSGTQNITISATDLGSAQKIFGKVTVGANTVTAGSNTDTLTFASTGGISATLDTSTNTVTFGATAADFNVSGFVEEGTSVHLTTITDNVGIGTSSPSSKLEINSGIADSAGLTFTQLTSSSTVGSGGGKVLSVDSGGHVILVTDQTGNVPSAETVLPSTSAGGTLYYNGTTWVGSTNLYHDGGKVGISTTNPQARFHVYTNDASTKGVIVQGYTNQTANLLEIQNSIGSVLASVSATGSFSNIGYATHSASLAVGSLAAQAGIGNAVFSGQVGIGTNNPGTSALKVVGAIAFTDNTTTGTFSAAGGGANYSSSGSLGISGATQTSLQANGGGTQFWLDAGKIYTPSNVKFGIGTSTPIATLDTRAQSATTAIASFSGSTNFAALVADNSGSGDIFTASSSGLSRFTITQAGKVGIGTTQPSSVLDVQNSLITTTNGISGTFNGLTTGFGLAMSSTGTALTSGGLASFDWSPGSATTATGDLVSLNVGANGVIGNIFNIKNNGSSVFSVGQNQIVAALPTAFTAPGDVTFAYDVQFSNPTASFIKSAAPLYLQSGETFGSNDLTLRTFNLGNVVIDSQALVANFAATVSGQLVVGTAVPPANLGNFYLTNSTTFGKALAILNQTETADILTASVSGVTKFVIDSTGKVGIGTALPLATLDTRALSGTTAVASVSGATTNAALIADNSGTGDIFTASSSGLNRFVVKQSGNVGIGTTTPTAVLDIVNASITSTNGIGGTFNGLTTGTGLALSSTSTALTTGGLASFDWSPGSATTATGDLVSLNVGANGVIGNIFNIKNNGSSVFSVSQSLITAGLPTAFTAPGDLGVAYDMQFTNPVSSFIKSTAPLYVQSGEVFNSSDLTLRTFNSGNIVLDAAGGVTLAQAQTWTLASSSAALNIGSGLVAVDTTNNRLGIGNTSPAFRLDVADSQSASATAMISNTHSGTDADGLAIKLGFVGTGTAPTGSPAVGNRFLAFLNGNGVLQGAVDSNASSGVTFKTSGIDLAEYFTKDNSKDELPEGTVVCQGTNGVRACRPDDNSRIIGVISAHPAFLGGIPGDDKVIVALTGQVPVRVTSQNGVIKSGDAISFADKSGVASKVTRAGALVGTALGNYTENDAAKEGMVMVYVKPGFTDPDAGLVASNLNAYSLLKTVSGRYMVETPFGQVVDRVLTVGDALVGNLQAGEIKAKHIQTDSLSIGELSLDQYIAQVVSQLPPSATPSSTLASTTPTSTLTATPSALVTSGIATDAGHIRTTLADLGSTADDVVLNATAVYLSKYFETAGNAFVGNNLGVNSNIVVGKGLVMSDVGLDYLDTLDSTDRQLNLLGSGKGSLNILAGALTLDHVGNMSIAGDIKVKGRITTEDPDVAGYARIKTGDTRVHITFARPYAEVPIITATSDDSDTHYSLKNKSVDGFDIILKTPAAEETTFNWTAISLLGAKTFESSGTSSVSGTVAGVSTP